MTTGPQSSIQTPSRTKWSCWHAGWWPSPSPAPPSHSSCSLPVWQRISCHPQGWSSPETWAISYQSINMFKKKTNALNPVLKFLLSTWFNYNTEVCSAERKSLASEQAPVYMQQPPGNPVKIGPLTDDQIWTAMVNFRSHTVTKTTHKGK